jgi:uncharacterized membrane protein
MNFSDRHISFNQTIDNDSSSEDLNLIVMNPYKSNGVFWYRTVDFNSILEQTKQENLFSASYVVVMLLVLNITFNIKLFNPDI